MNGNILFFIRKSKFLRKLYHAKTACISNDKFSNELKASWRLCTYLIIFTLSIPSFCIEQCRLQLAIHQQKLPSKTYFPSFCLRPMTIGANHVGTNFFYFFGKVLVPLGGSRQLWNPVQFPTISNNNYVKSKDDAYKSF